MSSLLARVVDVKFKAFVITMRTVNASLALEKVLDNTGLQWERGHRIDPPSSRVYTIATDTPFETWMSLDRIVSLPPIETIAGTFPVIYCVHCGSHKLSVALYGIQQDVADPICCEPLISDEVIPECVSVD